MMKYEEFKKEAKRVLTKAAANTVGLELRFERIKKINCELDGVVFMFDKEKTGVKISPTLYIQDMYEKYKSCEDIGIVLEDALDFACEACSREQQKNIKLDYENAKDNIVFQLINTVQNENTLKDVPNMLCSK